MVAKRARAAPAPDDDCWPWPQNTWATTDDLRTLCTATTNAVGEELKDLHEGLCHRIAELQSKVDIMEAKQLQYRGTWKQGTYAEGSIVSHSGSMWIARSVTAERPGNGPTAWLLTVKKGGCHDR